MEGHKAGQASQMASQMAGRPQTPQRAQRDMEDLQRLIRYVERWRMAHFQRPEEIRASMEGSLVEDMAGEMEMMGMDRPKGDRRLADADALLQKLRAGLSMAAQAEASMSGTQSQQSAYLA